MPSRCSLNCRTVFSILMAVKSPAKIRRKVWSMVQKVPVLPMPALHKESAEDSQETPKNEGGTKKKLCCTKKSHDFKAITASNKFGGDKKNIV